MPNTCTIEATMNLVSHSGRAIMAMRSLMLAGTIVVVMPLQPAHAQNVIFDQPKQIVGTPIQDAEAPLIAASGRSVYIVWHEYPDAVNNRPDIYFARSDNRGATFYPRMNLSNNAAIDSSEERIAASGRNVFVVWSEDTDSNGVTDSIFFRRSTDGGVTFKPAKKLSNAGGASNASTPQIAASGVNVFVAWQADGQNGNKDIFFKRSTDAGSNFVTENNISNNDGNSQFRDGDARGSEITTSGNDVIVTWRDDTVPGAGAEIFYAHGK